MALNIDPHTFGSTPAAALLAAEFNQFGDRHLVSRFSRLYSAYNAGLEAIIHIPGGTRQIVLRMWYQKYLHALNKTFGKEFAERGININIARNVLVGCWRRAFRDGDLYERLGYHESR